VLVYSLKTVLVFYIKMRLEYLQGSLCMRNIANVTGNKHHSLKSGVNTVNLSRFLHHQYRKEEAILYFSPEQHFAPLIK
jgi:hypothetical protein